MNGPDDIAKTILREIDQLKPTAKAGVANTVAQIAGVKPADLAKRMAPIKAALGKQSLTIVAEYVEEGVVYLTVEATQGGRARIHLGPTGGEIWVMPRPVSATKAPGKCVAVPKVSHPVYVNSMGIGQDGETYQGQNYWGFKTVRLADVDGDAILDSFVPVAKGKHDCPEKVSFRVYAMHSSAATTSASVGPGSVGGNVNAVPVDLSGWKPISTSATSNSHGKASIPESITTTRGWAVKAGRYAEISKRQSGGKCHHCATWSCTAASSRP